MKEGNGSSETLGYKSARPVCSFKLLPSEQLFQLLDKADQRFCANFIQSARVQARPVEIAQLLQEQLVV
jgi:hypothetical protein